MLRAAAAIGVSSIVLVLLWYATRPTRPSSGSDAARVQLVALLAAPPGAILPETADLVAQVAALRGRSERPLLRELLAEGPALVRLNAVRLLALMKDPAGEPVVEVMAREADELSRLVALDCAGRLQGRPPLGELERALSSPRADVRCYAILAFEAT